MNCSFIQDLTLNSQDAAIVQSIIHLAHQLNLEVVAEGVETETLSQVSMLYQQECDLLQGYFYARPAPPLRFKNSLFIHRELYNFAIGK